MHADSAMATLGCTSRELKAFPRHFNGGRYLSLMGRTHAHTMPNTQRRRPSMSPHESRDAKWPLRLIICSLLVFSCTPAGAPAFTRTHAHTHTNPSFLATVGAHRGARSACARSLSLQRDLLCVNRDVLFDLETRVLGLGLLRLRGGQPRGGRGGTKRKGERRAGMNMRMCMYVCF
jgi:hypothetical protein